MPYWNFYWVTEWDGSCSIVCATFFYEGLSPRETVSLRYQDGLIHLVTRDYFDSLRPCLCSQSDLNVR